MNLARFNIIVNLSFLLLGIGFSNAHAADICRTYSDSELIYKKQPSFSLSDGVDFDYEIQNARILIICNVSYENELHKCKLYPNFEISKSLEKEVRNYLKSASLDGKTKSGNEVRNSCVRIEIALSQAN